MFNTRISNIVTVVLPENHTNGITHICADGSYTSVHLTSGKSKVYCRNLLYWSRHLPEKSFLRCHHSYLVNKDHILEFCPVKSIVTLKGNVRIPVSRRKLRKIIELMQ